MMKKQVKITLIICSLLFLMTNVSYAANKDSEELFVLPENIIPLNKNNTKEIVSEDFEITKASESTKKLIEQSNQKIENQALIKLLNETEISPSLLSVGYRGEIYLGRWALHYTPENTTVATNYQLINTNEMDNRTGSDKQQIRFIQHADMVIKGALSHKVKDTEMIKKMLLQSVKARTGLPLSFTTVVGANTKLENYYHVEAKKQGVLSAHAPAIHENGKVASGEVYIKLKGSKHFLIVKNVTEQEIGAWIPIQNHVALTFQLN